MGLIGDQTTLFVAQALSQIVDNGYLIHRKTFVIGEYTMSEERKEILLYGASWCPDAKRARRFFDENNIGYKWIDIDENQEAEAFVRKTNGGEIIIPVIVFVDGSILVEPSNKQLADKVLPPD